MSSTGSTRQKIVHSQKECKTKESIIQGRGMRSLGMEEKSEDHWNPEMGRKQALSEKE